MLLFAQNANDAINAWLEKNPLVLGAGALALGAVLVGLGISALMTGEATTKRGKKLQGGEAKAMGFIWLGFGVLVCVFGLYKLVRGLM